MENKRQLITPEMKVGEFLEQYPELESLLISLAPAFEKLRNPILRRTIARLTSLSQAARVGGVSVAVLITRLRIGAGQPEFQAPDNESVFGGTAADQPEWFDLKRIHQSLDARAMIEAGEHPLAQVLAELSDLTAGSIYELITPFEPAPLIDKVKARGFLVWSTRVSLNEHRAYFYNQ